MKTMSYFLPKLLLLVCWLMVQSQTDARETPDFDRLIDIAKQYDMPMPPSDAKLVLATRGWTTLIQGRNSSTSRDPGIYQPAFLLKDESKPKQTIALFAWSKEKIRDHAEHHPATKEYSLEQPVSKERGYHLSLSDPACFVTSIQLAERGELDKANQLYQQFAEQKYIGSFKGQRDSLGSLKAAPEKLLAHCIYQYLYEVTLATEADQQSIYKKLVVLKENYPWLFSDRKQDYFRFHRYEFLQSLKASVEAKPVNPGSVEGLIVKWGDIKSKYRHLGFFDERTVESDVCAREIFWRGLKGMRDLVTLQNDIRLTKHVRQAIMNSPERRLRVGDLAKQLLEHMSGSFEIDEAMKKLQDESLDSSSFFQRAAFTRDKDQNITEVHEVPLRIVSRLHPESLADVAIELLENGSPDASLFSVFETIAESEFANERKSRLLCKLFDGLETLGQQRSLLQYLVKVDEKACVDRLIPILESLPADVDGPYWTAEEAHFTHVVVQCKASEVWDKYLKVVKRSSVGLRMEMMGSLNYSYIGDRQLKQRVRFLAQFLEDDELRDKGKTSQKYEGPCAVFTIPKIEVRNFVASKIDSLISKKSARPDEFWSEQQWATLRKKVATEVKRFEQK